jgi:pSer/pThr/pTyr-binding forkhead associated (FHA) protein
MAKLLVQYPDGTEEELPLESELTIGRAEGNGLILSEGGVSRRHARLTVNRRGEVTVEDLGSANGTYLDGEPVRERMPFTADAQLVIGDYVLSLVQPREKARPARVLPDATAVDRPKDAPRSEAALAPRKAAAVARASPPQGAGPLLRGLTGPWANRRYPIRGTVVVGRVPGLAVELDDDSVSRRHAEVEKAADGVWLRDLGSANGTFVNGEQVHGPVKLQAGDLLQFGVVELSFEVDEPAAASMARGTLEQPRPGGRRVTSAKRPGARGKSWKLFAVAAGALVVFTLGGGLWLASKATSGDGRRPKGIRAALPDADAQLESHLRQCRSYAAAEGKREPDWVKAQEACDRALDIEPIHPEANELAKRISQEKEASERFADGERMLSTMREEEAFAELNKIPQGSYYFARAQARLAETLGDVKKKTKEDCFTYAKQEAWEQAKARCGRYLELFCGQLPADDLHPPPNHELVLGVRPGKGQWQPRDPVLLRYFIARWKLDPKDPLKWECKPLPLIQREAQGPDIRTQLRQALQAKYPDQAPVPLALERYWDGKIDAALGLLRGAREDASKAAMHPLLERLMREIRGVDNLYNRGMAQIQGEPEKAERPFSDALAADQRLLEDQALTRPSFFRLSIARAMAGPSFDRGRYFMDRGDTAQACRVWKIGYRFSRNDPQLSKAVLQCTELADQLLAKVKDRCEDLARVMELAVDGDGIREKAEAKKGELRCP